MKAILKNGVIFPTEPLPADWSDGAELDVEKTSAQNGRAAGDDVDRWYTELESASAQMDPEDDRILKDAVREVRRQEKELARKEAGLNG